MIDLDKPLTPGAFCDISKIKQYTEDDYILPETPPFSWLMKKTKVCAAFFPISIQNYVHSFCNKSLALAKQKLSYFHLS